MKARKTVAIILSLVMCLTILAACNNDPGSQPGSGPGATSAPAPGGSSPAPGGAASPSATPEMVAPAPVEEGVNYAEHLNLILSEGVTVICPLNVAGTGGSPVNVYTMIYDTLFLDRDPEYLPNLGTSWQTDDYRTFVITLRDDVYFHNGDHFTAADVVWTIEKGASEGIGTPMNERWTKVETATALDPYTVEITLIDTDIEFIKRISGSVCSIVSSRAITEDPEKGWWVGTGAWMVSDFSSSDFVSFARNDNYWGELPLTKTQTWKLVPEASTRAIMLQSGEADIALTISRGDVAAFESNPDEFSVFKIVANQPRVIMFNQDDPITGDLNFREAVANALNIAEIALFANGDLAVPILDGVVWGYQTIYRNPNLTAPPVDLEKARAFLAASSYNGEPVELMTAHEADNRAAEAIQQQLSQIGINVVLNTTDVASLNANTSWTNNVAQMVIFVKFLTYITGQYRDSFYPGAVMNRSKFDNAEFNELIIASTLMFDENERVEAFHRLQEIVFENKADLPLYYLTTVFVGAKGIGGCHLPPSSFHDFRYMYRIID